MRQAWVYFIQYGVPPILLLFPVGIGLKAFSLSEKEGVEGFFYWVGLQLVPVMWWLLYFAYLVPAQQVLSRWATLWVPPLAGTHWVYRGCLIQVLEVQVASDSKEGPQVVITYEGFRQAVPWWAWQRYARLPAAQDLPQLTRQEG